MPKFDYFADIVFGSSDPSTSRAINRAVRVGRLHKLAPRLYTSLEGAPDAIVRQYWTTIAGHFFPGAVISHRSAFRGASIAEGVLFLTGDQDRDLALPGLLIRSTRGPGPLPGDMPFANGLFVSSQARYLLENLQPSRARKTVARTVPIEEIEERLQQVCNIRGEGELNTLRDEARALAPQLGPDVAEREWPKLDALIGALLGTRPAGGLKTDAGRARAAGQPYDAARVARFERLAVALRQAVFPDRPFTDRGDAWVNAAFFDAYFSNYIEGTKFPPDVAARIVFRGEIIPKRTADSHDVLGTYRVVSDRRHFPLTPESFDHFVQLLRERHATILEGRPDMEPGQFKEERNQAGNSLFVEPELVRGTLAQGFPFYQSLGHPFARAAYMMFLVAEVHPFNDGNGRIARAMMNAELAAQRQCRILIPTVYREDYLMALRNLTRNDEPDALIRMLSTAWDFADQLPFESFQDALNTLHACNAFEEPANAKLRFPEPRERHDPV